MAIIVEDGTGVANANSYVSEADLITYAAARGVTILPANTEEFLIRAMDYIESRSFKGLKLRQDQELQWPRTDVVIDSFLNRSDNIPDELINGLNETTLAINNGEDPLADIPRVQQSVTVGAISVDFKEGSTAITTVRKINAALRKVLRSFGGISFEVSR